MGGHALKSKQRYGRSRRLIVQAKKSPMLADAEIYGPAVHAALHFEQNSGGASLRFREGFVNPQKFAHADFFLNGLAHHRRCFLQSHLLAQQPAIGGDAKGFMDPVHGDGLDIKTLFRRIQVFINGLKIAIG